MKFLFLLWITIRSAIDAAAWATAVWCLLYTFPNVLWLRCFGVFLTIHFIGNLSFVKYIRTHTRQDCFSYMRRESVFVGLSILSAPIIAIIPAIAAILLLSCLQAWTTLETHWLHTLLFVTCVVYNLVSGREKRRVAPHGSTELLQRHTWKPRIDPKDVVEQPHCEEWVGSRDPQSKVARWAQGAANDSRSERVIDV